jgi:hypothetical protein
MAAPTFADVKAILHGLITAWTAQHGTAPKLKVYHGSGWDPPESAWETKEKLAAAKAVGLQLIDPNLAGKGKAKETNLYIALSTGWPDDGIPRMPRDGPYIADADLNKIVEWIDAGMPD